MVTAIYKRASDIKQEDGISIDMQQDEIEKYCTYKGYKSLNAYTEIKSARTLKGRIELNRLLNDVKEGRIQKVVVYKLDRLTRSLRDLMNILHTLKENGCELHSTFENIDTSTPSGNMLVQVLGIVAEWESANTSERVSTSMNLFASQGIWLSSIPFGFDRNDERRLVPNKKESSILKEAINLVFEGNSFSHAEDKIARKHGLSWSGGYLARKVKEQTMIGNIYRKGMVYENTHEGIITEDEQNKLLEILSESMVTNRNIEHNDIFRRRVSCSVCGYLSHTQVNSNDNYKTSVYSYYCGNCVRKKVKSPQVSERLLLEAFIKYMQQLDVDQLGEVDVKDDKSKKIHAAKNRLLSIDKERERIQRAWIKKLMTDDELSKYQGEIDDERLKIEDELSKLNVRTVVTKEKINEIARLFNSYFRILDRDGQREFVQVHIRKIEYSRKLIEGYQKKYRIKVESVDFF